MDGLLDKSSVDTDKSRASKNINAGLLLTSKLVIDSFFLQLVILMPDYWIHPHWLPDYWLLGVFFRAGLLETSTLVMLLVSLMFKDSREGKLLTSIPVRELFCLSSK